MARSRHPDKDIEEAVKRVKFGIQPHPTKDAELLTQQTLQKVDRFNRRDVQRTIGVNVPEYSTPLGRKWAQDHVALIKSMPERAKARFVGLLQDAAKKQTRVETLKGLLEEQFGINDRRARLIARDQILSLNAKLNQDRQQKAGITEYIWRTMSDGSVRSNHEHLNGKKFKYSEPPMGGGTTEDDRGNPGSGIGCRCQAIPVIPEFEKVAPKADPSRRNPLAFSTSKAAGPVQETHAPAPVRRSAVRTQPKATPLAASMQRAQAAVQKAAVSQTALLAAKDKLRKALVEAKDISLDQDSVAVMVSRFGRPLTPQQVRVFGGGKHIGATEVRVTSRGDRVTVTASDDAGTHIKRSFSAGPKGTVVTHDLFVVADAKQGKGLAKSVLRDQLREYQSLGVKRIKLDAAWVGRYTWASFGFQVDAATLTSLKRRLRGHLKNAGFSVEQVAKIDGEMRSIQDIADLEVGNRHVGKDFLLSDSIELIPDMWVDIDEKDPNFQRLKRKIGL
jgi:SPP1 gp7 family putative phage head morphogenesis protein